MRDPPPANRQMPIGAVPLGPAGWRAHFGAAWERFADAKRRYDPDGILTPGVLAA